MVRVLDGLGLNPREGLLILDRQLLGNPVGLGRGLDRLSLGGRDFRAVFAGLQRGLGLVQSWLEGLLGGFDALVETWLGGGDFLAVFEGLQGGSGSCLVDRGQLAGGLELERLEGLLGAWFL